MKNEIEKTEEAEIIPQHYIALLSLVEFLERKKRIERELLESNETWDDDDLEIPDNHKIIKE